jgi:hypothetical protein
MNCPHCGHHTLEPNDEPDVDDWFCPRCMLAGPRDVLEALAARLALASEMYDLIGRASQRAKPTRQQSEWMDDAATLRARWQHDVLGEGRNHG